MAQPKFPMQTNPVREFCAHVLQLCDYVEDMRTEPLALKLFDYGVMRAKALQVRAIADELSHTFLP